VRPFPNTANGRWQISTQGGQEPVWAHSGNELFYRVAGATNTQMVMDVAPGASFVPGARRVLFPLVRYRVSLAHTQYTVSPDDRRFIMFRASESERVDNLVAVSEMGSESATSERPLSAFFRFNSTLTPFPNADSTAG
jgi:hypothetical protein